MTRSLRLLVILVLLPSFAASGCGWIRKFGLPEVHSTPGTVTEVYKPTVVPVVVKNQKGELVRAYVVAQPGWLVGPPPPQSEVE